MKLLNKSTLNFLLFFLFFTLFQTNIFSTYNLTLEYPNQNDNQTHLNSILKANISSSYGVTSNISFLTDYKTIATGVKHTCVIAQNGSTYCWGEGSRGGLGNNVDSDSSIPVLVFGNYNFTSIYAAKDFTCGIIKNGSAYCWGDNTDSKLGIGGLGDQNTPTLVSGNHNFTKLSLGDTHVCGIVINKDMYCWGNDDEGKLGNSVIGDMDVPTIVQNNHKFIDVSVSGVYSCGIVTNNSLYCWGGDNSEGAFGNGSPSSSATPINAFPDFNLSQVSVDTDFICGLTLNGSVYCSGKNGDGNLGNGVTASSNVPVKVNLSLKVLKLSVGGSHSCVIVENGSAYCWGKDNKGQSGDGDSTVNLIPKKINSLEYFYQISSGDEHTCALTFSDKLYCWGEGNTGRLGTLGDTDRPSPVQIQPLFDWSYNLIDMKIYITPNTLGYIFWNNRVMNNYYEFKIASTDGTHGYITNLFNFTLVVPQITQSNQNTFTTQNYTDNIFLQVQITSNDRLIDRVYANLTYSNGSIFIIDLFDSDLDKKYNLSYQLEDILGTVNLTYHAILSYNISVSTQSQFQVLDSISPQINISTPLTGSPFGVGNIIEIKLNATDLFGVDNVYIEINNSVTGYNLTKLLSNQTNNKWNTSFTIPSGLGTYNITIFSNDTSNNQNNSVKSYFIVEDTTPPQINISIPLTGSSFEVGSKIEIKLNASDLFGVDNVSIQIENTDLSYNSGRIYLKNQSNNKWNISFEILAGLGTYNITIFSNDTSNNQNNSVKSYFIAQDTTPPQVNISIPLVGSPFEIGSTIEIKLNATDLSGVDNVSIQIQNFVTSYDSTRLYLLNQSNNKWNLSFLIPNVVGTYNITIFSNDTSNNQNNSIKSYFIAQDTTPPQINISIPLVGNPFEIGSTIEIKLNATDLSGVDNVSIQIQNFVTSYDSTRLYLLNQSNNKWNLSFIIPNVVGTYNITIFSNDTSNNQNNSIKSYFIAQDTTPPIFTLVSTNPTPMNRNITTTSVEINFTFNEYPVTINLTLTDYTTGNILANISNYNLNSNSNGLLTLNLPELWDKNYNLTISYWDLFNNKNSSFIGNITYNVGLSLESTNISHNYRFLNEEINFSGIAYNYVKPGGFYVNITKPISKTITQLFLNNSIPNSSLTTNEFGVYNLTFFIFDPSGNNLNRSFQFEVFTPIVFNTTVRNHSNDVLNDIKDISIIKYDTVLFNISNYISSSIYNTTISINYKMFNEKLELTLNNISPSNNNNLILKVDKNNNMSGFLRTYVIENPYTISNATIRIYYDDLSIHKNYLELWMCSDYNYTARTCNMSSNAKVSAYQDKINNYFELKNITSFSAFSIKDTYTEPIVPDNTGSGGNSKKLYHNFEDKIPQTSITKISSSHSCELNYVWSTVHEICILNEIVEPTIEVETFEDLKLNTLTPGTYKIKLTTLYGKNISDEFIQNFKIIDTEYDLKYFNILIFILLILIFYGIIIVYKFKLKNNLLLKKKKNQNPVSVSDRFVDVQKKKK